MTGVPDDFKRVNPVIPSPGDGACKEEECVCKNRGLEKGDTLYISADWDGGIGFDYIHNIQFCPVCGKELPEWRR